MTAQASSHHSSKLSFLQWRHPKKNDPVAAPKIIIPVDAHPRAFAMTPGSCIIQRDSCICLILNLQGCKHH